MSPELSIKLDDLWADFLAFDWENVVVSGMEHLAMPIVILIIALNYKNELTALLGRLKFLKGKDFIAEFSELEKTSEKITKEVREYQADDDEDLLTIAHIKPTAAVVESWKGVEGAILNLLPDTDFDTKQGRRQISGFQIIKKLETLNIITRPEIQALQELREIRNQAAHSVDRDITAGQAVKYVRMALAFSNKFNRLKSL